MNSRSFIGIGIVFTFGCSQPTAIENPSVDDLVGSWDLADMRIVNVVDPSQSYDLLTERPTCRWPLDGTPIGCVIQPQTWTIDATGDLSIFTEVGGRPALVTNLPRQVDLRDDTLSVSGPGCMFTDTVVCLLARYQVTIFSDRMILEQEIRLSTQTAEAYGFSVRPGYVQDATSRETWLRRD